MSSSHENKAERPHAVAIDDRWGFVKVGRRIAGFRKSRRGVAATEFALLAPFMIALWLGSSELTQGVAAERKVSLAASTLADLVTQQTNVTPTEMNEIMNATVAIMTPFSTANLAIEIAGVEIDEDGATNVVWSDARGAGSSAPTVGEGYDVPAELIRPESFLVVAQLRYAYTPPTMHTITGSLELSDSFFLRPRQSDTITNFP
ncbi:MAG: TadE/TadG family type IV pilus assembly protein [Pseudomonadota bacterium]